MNLSLSGCAWLALSLGTADPNGTVLPAAELAQGVSADAGVATSGDALVLDIDIAADVQVPRVGATHLELDVEVDHPFTLTFASRADGNVSWQGPPWRYRGLLPGRHRHAIDLRTTAGWSPSAVPMLSFIGTGRATLHELRVSGPGRDADGSDVESSPAFLSLTFPLLSAELARLLAPEALDHRLINGIVPPRLAGVALEVWLAGVGVLVAAIVAWMRRRRGPAAALRHGARVALFVAVAAFGLPMTGRLVASFSWVPTWSTGERLRIHHRFAPEVGALAALARDTIGPDERVGVVANPADWVARQVLCFHLMPRRCVMVTPGAERHFGLSATDALTDAELDVLVFAASPVELPQVFAKVAEVGPRSYIARRR